MVSRLTFGFSDTSIAFDLETRARSLLIPLRLATPLGRHLELEAGPEWRWMLQTRRRVTLTESELMASVPGPEWIDATSTWERSSFAVAGALTARWPSHGGEARIGFRWCEALGNQSVDLLGIPSRFRAAQVTLAWSR